MTSQVSWALLGLIIERPDYGGKLRQRLERAYGDVLPVRGESHIYIALDALKDRGLIEIALPEQPGVAQTGTDRQPRVRYAVTPQGLQAYRDRVFMQMGEDRRQTMLFIRQLAVFAHVPDIGLEIVERYAQMCATEARQAPIASASDSRAGGALGLAARLLAEEGRLTKQSKLLWSDYARKEFSALVRRDRDGAAGA